MSFERKKYKGGIQAVQKRTKEPGTVDVGIIDAGKHPSGDLTVAEIGLVHEFGAKIKHPGGTPYKIVDSGKALFLPKGDPTATGVTQPHNIIIPERSFMRSTSKERRKEIRNMKKKLMRKMVLGEVDKNKALGLVGEFLAAAIRKKIVAIRTPPNAPSTIAKKGSSNPLIDTGQMKNSITYEVNRE